MTDEEVIERCERIKNVILGDMQKLEIGDSMYTFHLNALNDLEKIFDYCLGDDYETTNE